MNRIESLLKQTITFHSIAKAMIPCKMVSPADAFYVAVAYLEEKCGIIGAEAYVYLLDVKSEGAIDHKKNQQCMQRSIGYLSLLSVNSTRCTQPTD